MAKLQEEKKISSNNSIVSMGKTYIPLPNGNSLSSRNRFGKCIVSAVKVLEEPSHKFSSILKCINKEDQDTFLDVFTKLG